MNRNGRERRAELKAFLRARRARIRPEEAGLPRGKRRIAPGLRREEVAAIAGVGVTWYTWLEQGRDINVSAETLRRVSKALKLSASDEVYLFTLAALPAPLPSAHLFDRGPDLEAVQRVVHGFTTGPAVTFGPRFDVLASNAVWDRIYSAHEYSGPFARNHVYRLFMDPVRRRLYADHDAVARNMVGLLRTHYAERLTDPDFGALVTALERESPDFARLWAERETQSLETFALRLRHEELGALAFDAVRFPVEKASGVLVFLGPPADAATAQAIASMTRHPPKAQPDEASSDNVASAS